MSYFQVQKWFLRKFDTAGEPSNRARVEHIFQVKVSLKEGFASSIKFADSSHRADTIEKAVRLAKPIGTFPTGACLFTISKLDTAGEPSY